MSQLGPILRLLGPLIELACISALIRYGRDGTIAGRPLQPVLWAGFVVGFVMVVAGLLLSKRIRPRAGDPIDRPLNL
jgi:hypothetical protein